MQWITANLTDMMSTYWWIVVGTVIGTAAIMSGSITPVAERLEEAQSALVLRTTNRWRVRGVHRSVSTGSLLSDARLDGRTKGRT